MKLSLKNALVAGLATAGSVFMIEKMQKEGLTNSGIILAGVVGSATIYGIGKLLGD